MQMAVCSAESKAWIQHCEHDRVESVECMKMAMCSAESKAWIQHCEHDRVESIADGSVFS